MKFLARHIILDADQEFPIYEVAQGENLADATERLAKLMATSTVSQVSFDPVRGVVLVQKNVNGPHDGAVLQNWPEGEPMQGNTSEPTVSAQS